MGVHHVNVPPLVREAIDDLTTDQLFELAGMIGVTTLDAPDSDLYDWLRQRIYDHLAPEIPRHAVAVLAAHYSRIDRMRIDSGGSPTDPYTGANWYRAQLVAIRDDAAELGVYDEMMEAVRGSR